MRWHISHTRYVDLPYHFGGALNISESSLTGLDCLAANATERYVSHIASYLRVILTPPFVVTARILGPPDPSVVVSRRVTDP
jgi:hypothetical protein